MDALTVWVLGDQLSLRSRLLHGLKPQDCQVLMVESVGRGDMLPYHKQKLIFLWSAMRHFAEELRQAGFQVDYYAQQIDFRQAFAQHVQTHAPMRVRLMHSTEHAGTQHLKRIVEEHGIACDVVENDMFISEHGDFSAQMDGRSHLRMETFYRHMRRVTGLLMQDDKPEGGQWNYDRENRMRPPKGHTFPPVPRYPPDTITQQVIVEVEARFGNHFGSAQPFAWPVTRQQAVDCLRVFLEERLDHFGPYQDAMLAGERALYHSLISPLINIGLLRPIDVCREAEARYHAGKARLQSVEGFIRQILGWREFMWQMYQHAMPGYLSQNYFSAQLPLPELYWDGATDMRCMADAVQTLQKHAHNHHIQRLMITGNFALIAGLNPQAVNAWYWAVYIDAFEWVVSPNVLGMALFADGGLLASKPYAASANYIAKMSDYCTGCVYHPRVRVGRDACPFNALYWDFLARNQTLLSDNPRMNLMLNNLRKKDPQEIVALRSHADHLRQALADGERF